MSYVQICWLRNHLIKNNIKFKKLWKKYSKFFFFFLQAIFIAVLLETGGEIARYRGKVMFQDLPSRLEQSVGVNARRPRARSMRFHPSFVDELITMSTRGEYRAGIAAMIIGSFYRGSGPTQ